MDVVRLASFVEEEKARLEHSKSDEVMSPRRVRSRAEELLEWADRAIEKSGNDRSTCDASTVGTELRPRASPMTRARRRVPAQDDFDEPGNNFVISNMGQVEVVNHCPCQKSILAQNPEHVEFYLPRLRVICNCGRYRGYEEFPDGTTQSCLVNILRDWQAAFMKSMGILTAVQLVDAHDHRSKELAKAMRRWRKEQGLFSVRSQSCSIALHIWSRTCQAVLKSILVENQQGGIRIHSILDISLSDGNSLSTLGFPTGGSVVSALDADNEVFPDTMIEV
jgi:hypothetical protein